MALKYTLVDVVPKSDSSESVQNSEPSITVDPLDPNQLIVGAFGSTGASYFESTDGGLTWSDYGNLVSNDKSLAWKTDGSAALTVTMDENASPNTFTTYSGTTADSNFGSPINVFSGDDLDQPWIRTGPSNHVYVAYNDLDKAGPDEGGTGNGGTASVLVSTDGGNTYTSVTLDRVGDPLQDDPSVRLAVNGNTVYGVFVRWTSTVEDDGNGERFNSQVVVVRSDNGGADGFTALGAGGNGVQVAAPIDVFTSPGGTSLSLGKERIAAEAAIAVDPNNPNHVLVAYQNAPGADGAGQVQLVLAESTDGGTTWSTKFTTSSSVRSSQEAISILDDGAIGFLYDSFDPATNELSQHFLTTTNDFATTNDTTLASESNASPSVQFQPYLGDFFDLTSVGNTFYGIFSASNADNGTSAQFANLTLQRDFTGTLGTGSFQLTGSNGNAVAASIDPYFFSATLQPPTLAGLSDASYSAFGAAVALSPALTVADVSSTTLDSATVQIASGTFTGDGDLLAADTNGTAIAASYNSVNETLTLMGLDTLADYQAVLDSVAFSSTSDPTNSGADDSRTVSWTVNDGSFSSTPQDTTIALSASPSPGSLGTVVAVGDFNGNGDDDLAYFNSGTSTTALQFLNGTTISGEGEITNSGVQGAPGWDVVAAGDFNHDGLRDLVYDNPTAGVTELQFLNGTTATGGGTIANSPIEGNPSWTVAGAGDFNGDGYSDLVYDDASVGVIELQFLNGTTAIGGGEIANSPLENNPAWTVAGVGDFNHDGFGDLVYYDASLGATELQFLQGTTAIGGGEIANSPIENNPAWTVAGVGDFNHDGFSDLAYYNASLGVTELQFLQGTAAIGGGEIVNSPFENNPSWTIAGVGDFNGDGTDDLLYHNASTGAYEVQLLDGTTATSTQALSANGALADLGNASAPPGLADAAPAADVGETGFAASNATTMLGAGLLHPA